MFLKNNKWFNLFLISFILTGCGLFSDNNNEEPVPEEPTEEVQDPSGQNEDTEDEEPADDADSVDEEPAADTDQVNQDVAAWFPRLDNVVYTYEGIGNEYAAFSWNPQFNQENYYQTATDNSGTTLVEIFVYEDDKITRTFQAPETYFRDNFSAIGSFSEHVDEEVILQAPIEVGTSWSNPDSDYEITAVNHEITVSAGTYDTIEVTNTLNDMVIKRYYAEDVGLVYELSEAEEMTVESNLESIETDTAESIPFTVFVPDDQAMGLDQVDAQLTLNTNDPARVAITELLSGQNNEFENINLLPEGTTINYLFLNDNRVVEMDVSSEFVDNMNAGSTGEMFAIYTLVNTITQYYGAQEVLLTVDGEPYQGAHMALQEGETLSFNADMVNE